MDKYSFTFIALGYYIANGGGFANRVQLYLLEQDDRGGMYRGKRDKKQRPLGSFSFEVEPRGVEAASWGRDRTSIPNGQHGDREKHQRGDQK